MSATANPKLLFKAGQFHVTAEKPETRIRLSKALSKNPYWLETRPQVFSTTHMKSAASFRRFASPAAESILKNAFQEHYELPGMPPILELDPHQREGLEWVLSRKRAYLAHAPGAGKTAQAILAACLATGPGRALFIVPPSLTLNWEREIRKVTEWVGVWPYSSIVPGSNKQDTMDWAADFIICPDSMITRDWVQEKLVAMDKKLIAVDEASRFKEPLAERSLAFYGGRSGERTYPGLYQSSRHVVFLDGSPMPNRPMELWAPTYALHPEAIDCMDQDDFGYRYCGPRITERGQYTFLHSSREDELKQKLQADFMHVVGEGELSHPERLRSMLFMNEDVRSPEHKTWERAHLSKLTELDETASQGDMARFRKELGLRKVKWIAGYVSEKLKEKNESILLFAWHREVCEQLMERLSEFKPGLVMGGVSSYDRELAFSDFQAGICKLIILNIAAGGRGHNLQRADRVIFGEFSWTDELNRQCEKRASRRGNEKQYTRCEYIVAPNSMDERVLSSIFTKQKRVERIIGE